MQEQSKQRKEEIVNCLVRYLEVVKDSEKSSKLEKKIDILNKIILERAKEASSNGYILSDIADDILFQAFYRSGCQELVVNYQRNHNLINTFSKDIDSKNIPNLEDGLRLHDSGKINGEKEGSKNPKLSILIAEAKILTNRIEDAYETLDQIPEDELNKYDILHPLENRGPSILIKNGNRYPEVQEVLGLLAWEKTDYKKAIEHFERSDYKLSVSKIAYAICLLQEGRTNHNIESYLKSQLKNHSSANEIVGINYFNKRNYSRALIFFEKAEELRNKRGASDKFNILRTRLRLGQTEGINEMIKPFYSELGEKLYAELNRPKIEIPRMTLRNDLQRYAKKLLRG